MAQMLMRGATRYSPISSAQQYFMLNTRAQVINHLSQLTKHKKSLFLTPTPNLTNRVCSTVYYNIAIV